ncbi:MAG: hypothetical protein WD049_03685 [Candidatus Paceibacterota bacterium]
MAWISDLQKKPPEVRQKMALLIAGGVTALILVVWVGFRMTDWEQSLSQTADSFGLFSASVTGMFESGAAPRPPVFELESEEGPITATSTREFLDGLASSTAATNSESTASSSDTRGKAANASGTPPVESVE